MSKIDIIRAGEALFTKVIELKESTDLFSSPIQKAEELLPYCRGLLEASGFKIISPMKYDYNDIENVTRLIDFFYDSFKQRFPKEITPFRDDIRDKTLTKHLLEKLMSTGDVTKKMAIAEAAEIIDVVLSNPDKFPLVLSIGYRIFGQGDMSWATEKALAIINEERGYKPSAYFDKLNDLCNETFEGEIGFNFDKIEENDNGKEENRS